MRAEPTMTEKLLSLREKEIKELRIERAEHIRKIEQLEEQNEDFLLELASLKMTMPSSGGGGGGLLGLVPNFFGKECLGGEAF